MKSLPNILTIFRIVSLPILILLILSPDQKLNFYAFILFILISASDFFDGYFARMMNVESSFGAYFDVWIDEPGVQLWIGMVVSFIAVILLGMFVARILSKIFRLSLSSKIDRFLGACFGFLRGCILTAIFVLAGELTTATEKKWWDESNLIPYSKILADKMIMSIPANIDFIRTEKGKE